MLFIPTQKKNFDDFTAGFTEYNEQEGIAWASNNYLGALMRFDISVPGTYGLMTQDGSVVYSDQDTRKWIFTTTTSPQDFSHPVSGNREFGLKPNLLGGYIFYTRGVDRVAESPDYYIGTYTPFQHPFDGGYDLWESVMNNLVSFVNDDPWYGGSSFKYPAVSNVEDYQKVKDVLEGNRPISDLGCK